MNEDEASDGIGDLVLVDDNELDQYLHRRVIERTGLVERLHIFSSARTALEYLYSGANADVVLLDIRMPEMDGFGFLDALEASGPAESADFAVVMLSTSQNPDDLSRAQESSYVVDYLVKPLTEEMVEKLAGSVSGGLPGRLARDIG